MSYEDSNDFGAIRCGQDGVEDKNLLLRGASLLFQRSGGTEAMRIDSSGNLLVGATSFNTGAFGATKGINVAHTQPIVLLHETDTDKDGYIGMASSTMFIGTADAIPMRFSTSDTERMRITSSGAIGFGTTPHSDTHTGWNQFFIGQKASLFSENATGTHGLDGTFITDNIYVDSDTGSFANIETNESSAYRQEGGEHLWYSQSSGSAGAAVSLSEKMKLNDGVLTLTSNTPNITFIESDASNKQYQVGSFGAAFAVYDASLAQYRYIIDAAGNHIFNEGSADTDFRVESDGNTHMLFVDGGNNKVRVGTSAGSQTDSPFNTRRNGANIEFGHSNNGAGYYGTVGAWGSAGHPYIGLSTDCENSANTFSTRGNKGNLIYSNTSSGDLIFAQLTTASATGQTPTTRMVLNSSGDAQFYNRIFAGGGTGANTSVNADDIVIGLTDNSTERGITIASTAGGGIRWNDGADAGTLQYVHSTNRMQFYTGGSLRASIDSEGLKFNGDTSIVNALNDYETGTWTPAVSHGGTAATMVDLGASGSYTKIGRMVTLQGNAKIQTVNGTGAAIITGFPYTVGDTVANTGVEGNGVIGYYASWGDNVNSLVVLAVQSTTTGEIYGNHNASGLNSGATTITQAELNASAEFRFTLTYFTS
jgi:hypothetical protein